MESIFAILKEYSSRFALPTIGLSDIIEILLITVLIYKIIVWFRDSRTGTIIKGIMTLVVFTFLASVLHFDTILWLLKNSLTFGITAALIIFQPELRRVLEDLGRGKLFSNIFNFDTQESQDLLDEKVINEIVRATVEMSKVKTGALIVIQQEISLSDYVDTGIMVDGLVSSQLLINIFEHNTPLHDGAVIIKGNRVVAATCYLPLTSNGTLSKELGTRHRAAVGVSEATDSYTIVVSEETGKISVASDKILVPDLTGEELKARLMRKFVTKKSENEKAKIKLWKGRRNAEDQPEE